MWFPLQSTLIMSFASSHATFLLRTLLLVLNFDLCVFWISSLAYPNSLGTKGCCCCCCCCCCKYIESAGGASWTNKLHSVILLQLKSIRVCGPRYWPQVIKLTPEGILLILNISHFSSEFFFIIFLSWLSNRQAMVEIRRQDRSLQRGRTLHKAKSWIMLLLWWSNWLPVFDFAGNAWG